MAIFGVERLTVAGLCLELVRDLPDAVTDKQPRSERVRC